MIILVFSAFYIPGYRGGGPIRSIQNLVERMGNEFDFRIFCSDRDLGDKIPYQGVICDQWIQVGPAKVFYASPKNQTAARIKKIIEDTPHDILYLNSAFSLHFSIIPLLTRKLQGTAAMPVILAPRGEFSAGALAIKSFKKKIFISIAKLINLYSGVNWQASSKHEFFDIERTMKKNSNNFIIIASDILSITTAPNLSSKVSYPLPHGSHESSKKIKILFLSRLSPKKNLEYALKILSKVSIDASFSIIGPKEDPYYWEKCEKLIPCLPPNIEVKYLGVANPAKIPEIMTNYDIFFFPTLGENFGHVIIESMISGTPVLISDRTPWRNLREHGAGWDLPLESPEEFISVIENYSKLTLSERHKLRESTRIYANSHLEDSSAVDANRQLFIKAAESCHRQ